MRDQADSSFLAELHFVLIVEGFDATAGGFEFTQTGSPQQAILGQIDGTPEHVKNIAHEFAHDRYG